MYKCYYQLQDGYLFPIGKFWLGKPTLLNIMIRVHGPIQCKIRVKAYI